MVLSRCRQKNIVINHQPAAEQMRAESGSRQPPRPRGRLQ